MRDLIILPSWLVVNPSPEPEVTEPEVTEPFWSEWFSGEERSDEVRLSQRSCGRCPLDARDPYHDCAAPDCFGPDEGRSDEVTELRGVDCQCAICLGGSN